MDACGIFNLCEGVFWIFVGGLCLVRAMVGDRKLRKLLIFACGVFVAFGSSDFVTSAMNRSLFFPWKSSWSSNRSTGGEGRSTESSKSFSRNQFASATSKVFLYTNPKK